MASYYNQNIIIHTLVISLLCIICHTTHARNDALINKMCGATYAPNVCISCVNSSGTDVEDDIGVISAMLDCGNDDVLTFEEDVNKIIDNTMDPKLRLALVSINPFIQDVIVQGGTVQDLVAIRRFRDARYTIHTMVNSKLGTCNALLNASGVDIPPPVFSGLFNVEADLKLSDQLIATEPTVKA